MHDQVDEAWDTKQWPAVADDNWTWEPLKFVTPPYWVPEEGKPWRAGRAEAFPVRGTKGKGKGKKGGKDGDDGDGKGGGKGS